MPEIGFQCRNFICAEAECRHALAAGLNDGTEIGCSFAGLREQIGEVGSEISAKSVKTMTALTVVLLPDFTAQMCYGVFGRTIVSAAGIYKQRIRCEQQEQLDEYDIPLRQAVSNQAQTACNEIDMGQ